MGDRWWHGWRLPRRGRWRLEFSQWRASLHQAGLSDLTLALLAVLAIPLFFAMHKMRSLLWLPFVIGGLRMGTAASISDPLNVTTGFWTRTLTASAGVGATNEAKITNIIARAVALGYLYVYIPASMLSYNPTLVTFNTAIKMITEGQDPSEWNILAYGGNPTGATFSDAAFTAAIAGAAATNPNGTTGGIVRVPAGVFNVLTVHLKRGVTLRGDGAMGTATATSVISGQSGSLAAVQLDDQNGTGAIVEDLGIQANNGNPGGLLIQGMALCKIRRVQVVGGTASQLYAFRVQGGTTAGDSVLNLFDTCFVNAGGINSAGYDLLSSATSSPNGIKYISCGLSTLGSGGIGFRTVSTGGPTIDSAQIINCDFNFNSAADQPLIVADCSSLRFFSNRCENDGTGGLTITLSRNTTTANGIFVGNSYAPGSGVLTFTDASAVKSPRIAEQVSNLVLLTSALNYTDSAIALVSGVAPALNAALGTYYTLAILTNIAVVVGVPTNPPTAGLSRVIQIAIRNASGGALTTPATFNGAANGFKFNGTVSPANGQQIVIEFCWDPIQSFWYETSRGVAL